ncbi:MAG: MotA/TolQ/ExbB proton channel family protein [Cytophagaceae bacterium]|jgi:biopolymer transport protein ExbB|nr:MotA/TolQ/ExbB proton channel family protein [Cytophagaceae bacterium]
MNLFMMIQAAGRTLEADGTGVEEVEQVSINVLELLTKGGSIMIVLAILSIISVAIFIERFMVLRKASNENTGFMNRIKDYIHDGKIDSALALCQSSNHPIARMIEKGVSRIGRPLNDVNTAIENVGNLEITRLERGLPIIASVSGGAPMIGFLGTVIGMIQSFFEMANAGGNVDVSMLAGGIYTALVTTVGGLIVGIIAYFAYNILVARVERVVFKMQARTMEFMDILNEPAR